MELKMDLHKRDFGLCRGLIKKSIGNYRRTPRGREKEGLKNARKTGTTKTPRFDPTKAVVSNL
jgi:hypothetical protein